jgi:hypothetical protein
LEPGLFRSERQHSSAYNTNSVIEVPSVSIELKTEKQVGDLDGRFFFFFYQIRLRIPTSNFIVFY